MEDQDKEQELRILAFRPGIVDILESRIHKYRKRLKWHEKYSYCFPSIIDRCKRRIAYETEKLSILKDIVNNPTDDDKAVLERAQEQRRQRYGARDKVC